MYRDAPSWDEAWLQKETDGSPHKGGVWLGGQAFYTCAREAVKRINADKSKYLRYFIDYHAKKDKDIAALKPEDLRASRIVVCDPAPIPMDEMQRTYDWLKSWGMLEQTASPQQLVNMQVQQGAHQVAAE